MPKPQSPPREGEKVVSPPGGGLARPITGVFGGHLALDQSERVLHHSHGAYAFSHSCRRPWPTCAHTSYQWRGGAPRHSPVNHIAEVLSFTHWSDDIESTFFVVECWQPFTWSFVCEKLVIFLVKRLLWFGLCVDFRERRRHILIACVYSSLGRVTACSARGREFDSRRRHIVWTASPKSGLECPQVLG